MEIVHATAQTRVIREGSVIASYHEVDDSHNKTVFSRQPTFVLSNLMKDKIIVGSNSF